MQSLTGGRYLAGYADSQQQYQALMASGIEYGNRSQIQISGSTIASLGSGAMGSGNVSLEAGHAYSQSASQVIAPQGDIAIRGQSVAITAGQDTHQDDSSHSFRQGGLSLDTSVPLRDTLRSITGRG